MPNTEEQRLDVIENCDILLHKFQGFAQTDDTPEGRMLAQLNWLKERAENHDLPLPVDPVMLSTLRYIYRDATLTHHASNPHDNACVYYEIELPMSRLLALAKNGSLLMKPAYRPFALRCIDALLRLLQHPTRPLSPVERGSIGEIQRLRQILADDKALIPLVSFLPEYRNFRNVDQIGESSIDDLPNGNFLCTTVADVMFNTERPSTWLTPAEADRLTRGL